MPKSRTEKSFVKFTDKKVSKKLGVTQKHLPQPFERSIMDEQRLFADDRAQLQRLEQSYKATESDYL